MEILYSIFIGIIFGMIVGMIVGIGLLCRRDTQRDRVQVRVFKRRNHASLDLFWNGRPRLLEDLGA